MEEREIVFLGLDLLRAGLAKTAGEARKLARSILRQKEKPAEDPLSPKKKFLVVWERMANSGVLVMEAKSPEEAVCRLGFSPLFCKITAAEIVGNVITIGEAK